MVRKAKSHESVEVTVCVQRSNGKHENEWDPACKACDVLATSQSVSLPQLFALMRQWDSRTQSCIDMLINEVRLRAHGYVTLVDLKLNSMLKLIHS